MRPDTREASRPDADALIAAAARQGRGRLKLFLGASPWVNRDQRNTRHSDKFGYSAHFSPPFGEASNAEARAGRVGSHAEQLAELYPPGVCNPRVPFSRGGRGLGNGHLGNAAC
jgi:hypothetical protein